MKQTLQAAIIVLLWPCCMAAGEVSTAPELQAEVLKWDVKDNKLPSLPQEKGLAGAFVGVSEDALIVAGGTSLADGSSSAEIRALWHDQCTCLPSRTLTATGLQVLTRRD